MLQTECALPILSWYEDMKDRALIEMIPLLIELSKIDDVRDAIPRFVKNNLIDFSIAVPICSALLPKEEPSKQSHIELVTSESDARMRESTTSFK